MDFEAAWGWVEAQREMVAIGRAKPRSDTHRALLLAAEIDQWRARFEWLASQHWVEPEATFRLDLRETQFIEPYIAALVAAIDAKLP